MSDIIEELDNYLDEADPKAETPPEEEAPEEPAEEEAPAAEAETEEPEAEETPVERDERLTAYLDKYGGDVDKALTAAVEAQELLGRQGSELGELRKEIQALSERIPEQEEDDPYVPMDSSTVSWFDTLMEENPLQAMEWARQNDSSGTYYSRGMAAWMDTNPAQASTYQMAVMADALRKEFKEELSEKTRPYQADHQRNTINQAWQMAVGENPDIANHADAILQEAKDSPELLRGADTPEAQKNALHKLYRLVKGAAATTLEAATEEAETERKQANRSAKLSGTTPQTKAVSPEPAKSEGDQWLEDIGFDDFLERRSPSE